MTTAIKTPVTVLPDSTPATSILIYKMLFVVLFTQTRDNNVFECDWTHKERINNPNFQKNIKETLQVQSIENDVIISINYAIYVKTNSNK